MKRRTNDLSDGVFHTLPFIAGALVVAGLVHIATIFLLPRLAAKDAFARVSAVAPLHELILLPSGGEGPFDDPALAQGLCRFDLAQGPLRLRANLAADHLMLFSFHARDGQFFYSMTDRSATRGKLDLLLVTRGQLDAVEANDPEDELPQDLRILAPTQEGFLLFRSLAAFPGEMAQARARIAALSCGLDGDRRP